MMLGDVKVSVGRHREGKLGEPTLSSFLRPLSLCSSCAFLTQEGTLRGGQVAGRAGALVREGIVTGQQLARVALHGVLRAVPRTTCLGRLLDGGAGEVVFPSCRHAFYGFRTGGEREEEPGTKTAGGLGSGISLGMTSEFAMPPPGGSCWHARHRGLRVAE